MGKGGALRVDATSEALREGVKAPPLFTPLDLASLSLSLPHTQHRTQSQDGIFQSAVQQGEERFGSQVPSHDVKGSQFDSHSRDAAKKQILNR